MAGGNTVFVTIFDYDWNRLGSATFEASLIDLGDSVKLDILALRAVKQANFLPEGVKNVHMALTLGEEATAEVAKRRFERRGPEHHVFEG